MAKKGESRRHGRARPAAERAEPPARSPRGPALWLAAGIVLLSFVALGDLRHADFVQLDDPAYVSENPRVASGLTPSSVAWAFTTFDNANWHPLTWLSHLLDVEIFGLAPGPHHVTNLVLHTIAALLLFGVLFRMTGSLSRSAFVGALFAVHPAHVESVAWISERKDVLSACFWMLTLWAYVNYVRQPSTRRYLVTVVVFALGLMAKPMLVTLPFVLLLLDVWMVRGSEGPMVRRSDGPTVRALVLEKVPLLALSALSCVITVVAQQQGGAVMSLETVPFVVRVQNALVSYITYIGTLVWPTDLAMFYPHRAAPSIALVIGAIGLLVAITATVLSVARRLAAPAVGWFWYLGTLVPVIGIVQVGRQALADRYTYIPFIGLFILIAWAVPVLARRAVALRAGVAAAAVAVLIACVAVSRAQVQHWQTNTAFWERALAVTLRLDPARAQLAVAGATIDARHVSDSVALFFRRDATEARLAVGAALLQHGHAQEAVTTFREVLAGAPGLAVAHEQLGHALVSTGRSADAVTAFREAIRLAPDLQPAHANLGRLLGQLSQFPSAAAALTEAVRLNPSDANARCDLGLALANQGKFDEAMAQYQEALKLNPNLPELHNNIGLALANQDRLAEAVLRFLEAVRLRPAYVEALRNLGIAHLRLKQPGEAAAAFSAVLRFDPRDETARNGLALLSKGGRGFRGSGVPGFTERRFRAVSKSAMPFNTEGRRTRRTRRVSFGRPGPRQ